MKNSFRVLAATLGLAFSFALAGVATNQASAVVDDTPDCDNVAVIKCGVSSVSDMRSKASKGDVPKIYNALGVSQSDLKSGSFVNGIVWRDGRVTVDGKTVATNAQTAGRNYGGTPISGTNAGKYSTSKFVTEGQTAYIKMTGGKFDFAVIKSCGNPVSATPKPEPKPEPKPTYACTALTQKQITRTKFTYTATASATNGAKVANYRYDFGDGKSSTTTSRTVSHEYAKAGTYTTKVTALVTVNGKTVEATSAKCAVKVTVKDEPKPGEVLVCNPETGETITVSEKDASKYKPVGDAACGDAQVCNPETGEIITVKQSEADKYKPVDDEACKDQPEEVLPASIAETGPGAAIGGLMGAGALGYGAYNYLNSRRNLKGKFLNR